MLIELERLHFPKNGGFYRHVPSKDLTEKGSEKALQNKYRRMLIVDKYLRQPLILVRKVFVTFHVHTVNNLKTYARYFNR